MLSDSISFHYLPRFRRPFERLHELPPSRLNVVRGRGHVVLDAVYQFALLALRSVALGGNGTYDRTSLPADWFIRFNIIITQKCCNHHINNNNIMIARSEDDIAPNDTFTQKLRYTKYN